VAESNDRAEGALASGGDASDRRKILARRSVDRVSCEKGTDVDRSVASDSLCAMNAEHTA
jgi:hypothetical protein